MGSIRPRSILKLGTAIAVVAVLLSGCAREQLAADYASGGNKNYVAGDGSIKEIAPADRGKPITFSGVSDAGATITSDAYRGRVLVVNFWAGYCAPCRVEAPELEKLAKKWDGNGAAFLGVNTYDEAPTAQAFARTYGVTYPSLIDAKTGAVQLAFAGSVPPSALPTTIVLDKQGRVAARILGQLQAGSILEAIITTVANEGN